MRGGPEARGAGSLFGFLAIHKGFVFLRTRLVAQGVGKDRVKHSMGVSLSGGIFTDVTVLRLEEMSRLGREKVLDSTPWDLLLFVISILAS